MLTSVVKHEGMYKVMCVALEGKDKDITNKQPATWVRRTWLNSHKIWALTGYIKEEKGSQRLDFICLRVFCVALKNSWTWIMHEKKYIYVSHMFWDLTVPASVCSTYDEVPLQMASDGRYGKVARRFVQKRANTMVTWLYQHLLCRLIQSQEIQIAPRVLNPVSTERELFIRAT